MDAGRSAIFSLGVNVDHVATLRQARGTNYPAPMRAALVAEGAGARSITVHLREDRRHIQDRDVLELNEHLSTKLNLEMAVAEEIVAFACRLGPPDVCLVPEKREELTTEGGLAVRANSERLRSVVARLNDAGSRVSLFIEPSESEIEAAVEVGAQVVELHTGQYADSQGVGRQEALKALAGAATHAHSCGLAVNGGHGLNVDNVAAIAALAEIEELNIGHSIICDSVFLGLHEAVARMLGICLKARAQAPTGIEK